MMMYSKLTTKLRRRQRSKFFTRVEPMSSRQAMMSYGLYDDSTPGLSKGFVVESFVGCPQLLVRDNAASFGFLHHVRLETIKSGHLPGCGLQTIVVQNLRQRKTSDLELPKRLRGKNRMMWQPTIHIRTCGTKVNVRRSEFSQREAGPDIGFEFLVFLKKNVMSSVFLNFYFFAWSQNEATKQLRLLLSWICHFPLDIDSWFTTMFFCVFFYI